ncbi:hypothetical protein M3Y99_00847300 [Aphelenchoides fujianensis]|nr:hypothetical protein M3Y99_00847300 [Aphelenchoides fujianensis]
MAHNRRANRQPAANGERRPPSLLPADEQFASFVTTDSSGGAADGTSAPIRTRPRTLPPQQPAMFGGEQAAASSDFFAEQSAAIGGESFVLPTKLGQIHVTLEDLQKVGVNVSSDVINVDDEQADALAKLFFGQQQAAAFDPPAQPTSSSSKPEVQETENLYAYVGDNGSVSLIQGKSGKTVVRFEKEELQRLGIEDATRMSESDLERLAFAVAEEQRAERPQPSTVQLGVPRQNEGHSMAAGSTEKPPSFFPLVTRPPPKPTVDGGFLGVEVEVATERSPQPRAGVIRYARKSGMFKVQFANGSFEWVSKTQIRTKNLELQKEIEASAQEPAAAEPEKVPQPPPKKARKQCLLQPDSTICAVCDTRIAADQQPAFIVLRIPACRPCSLQKAMFVEETERLD